MVRSVATSLNAGLLSGEFLKKSITSAHVTAWASAKATMFSQGSTGSPSRPVPRATRSSRYTCSKKLYRSTDENWTSISTEFHTLSSAS